MVKTPQYDSTMMEVQSGIAYFTSSLHNPEFKGGYLDFSHLTEF